MTAKELPSRPDLDQYRKQAKDLLKSYKSSVADALTRVTQHHPEFRKAGSADAGTFLLSDAQWVIAREHGFESWAKFADHIRRSRGSRILSATAFRDTTVSLWDVDSERSLQIMNGHSDGVYDVAFDPAQHRALSGSRDGTIRIWDLETGKCLQVFERHSYHVHSVLWSSDGRRVLSSSQDIRLWDVPTGRCIRVFDQEHTQVIRRLAWSSDQRTALSASHDSTVRVWDVENGRCVRVFEGHPAGVISVALSSDQRRAYSCDWNGGLRVWDV